MEAMGTRLRRSTEVLLFRFMKKLGCWLAMVPGVAQFFMESDGDRGSWGNCVTGRAEQHEELLPRKREPRH